MPLRPRHTVVAVLAVSALVAPTGGHADGGPAARARAASDRCGFADALPGQAGLDDVRAATLCLMNAQRTARGLGRLRDQPSLAAGATRYARQMVRQRFFDHTSPGGSTMVSRIKATSYLRDVVSWSVGENLAWGTGTMASPRATVQAWMRSADHRANLLNRSFADVGIGIAEGAPEALGDSEVGGTYVTDFGRRRRG
ncbi:MAG TPA: CAP domain-containing protein [Solirubrobacteraceae bacterium]